MADSDAPVFAISVAARMASMEIQNLRVYERHGLVSPDRTPGGTRLYSADDVTRLVHRGAAGRRAQPGRDRAGARAGGLGGSTEGDQRAAAQGLSSWGT